MTNTKERMEPGREPHSEDDKIIVQCQSCGKRYKVRYICKKCLSKHATVVEPKIPVPEDKQPPEPANAMVKKILSTPKEELNPKPQPKWQKFVGDTHNRSMICPHCGERGRVTTSRGKQKSGISGGKATAAIFTGGTSLLFTGLSRKHKVTKCHCHKCGARWSF